MLYDCGTPWTRFFFFLQTQVENSTFPIVKMAKMYATFDMVVCLDAGFQRSTCSKFLKCSLCCYGYTII